MNAPRSESPRGALPASRRSDEAPSGRDGLATLFLLEVYCFSRVDLLCETTDILRKYRADVLDISESSYSAPHVGSSLFTVEARFTLADGAGLDDLEAHLAGAADRLGWDFELSPAHDRSPCTVPAAPFGPKPIDRSASSSPTPPVQ